MLQSVIVVSLAASLPALLLGSLPVCELSVLAAGPHPVTTAAIRAAAAIPLKILLIFII